MARMMRLGLAAAGLVTAIAAVTLYGGFSDADGNAPRYRLATVERGPMASTVAASGTLEPVIAVDVGSQVSGIIKTLHADFNSEVKAGQVIARIDSAPFEAKLKQAEAELAVEQARGAMHRAELQELEAELDGHRAALTEATEELRRKRSLYSRRVVASSAVDTALANHDQAKSRVSAAIARLVKQKAQIRLTDAQIMQKEAVVRERQLDLDHTYIRSPVNGVVISRNVDAGQTVAASLQAPVLFRIAQDLSQMQIGVSVDEADIGQVRVGQKATFTVDSFPGDTFEGHVHQVRKAGIEVSNVITYTVVVTADNADQRLLPGMTANMTIVVSERSDALKVSNTALRFRPAGATAATGMAGAGNNARARAEQRLKRMTERLGLTAEQQEGVRAIFSETRRKIRGLRRRGLSLGERTAAIKRIRERAASQTEVLLTAKQRDEYRKMRASRNDGPRHTGHVWVPDEAGRPRQVPVVYGITDGDASEILRGDLKAGQKVIVGIIEGVKAPATRLRFRF